ncbi:MAG: hypothetical protein H0V93_08870 [Euzebyales bacterium]|jgi:hypothetical protein|nr:hypothetical protein [Euzebyales bacterium]
MARLREVFPLLDELPSQAAELGLSLDSDSHELRSRAEGNGVLSNVLQAFVSHLIETEDRKLTAQLSGLRVVREATVETAMRQNRSRNALSRGRQDLGRSRRTHSARAEVAAQRRRSN